jgi:hypothetical protein
MPRYFIQAPHSAETCATVRAALLNKGPGDLIQFDFACAVGDGSNHVAIAILDLGNEMLPRETVPGCIRDEVVVVEVRKVMPEEVRAAH